MDKNPIVYVLGVEGQFFLAEALRNEFQRPVVGILTSQRAAEMVTPDRRAIFTKIYSLPDFYLETIDAIRALPREARDQEQQALERELGITNGAILAFYDRTMRGLNDDEALSHWELCNLRFAKKIIDEIKPAFMLDGVVLYLQHVLRAAARVKNIPYFLSEPSRTGNQGVSFFQEDGQQVGMAGLFAALQSGQTASIPAQTLAAADAAFDAFITRPLRPAYAQLNAVTGFNFKRIAAKARWALRSSHLFPSERVRQVDRALNIESSPGMIARNAAVSFYRRTAQKILKVFDEKPDLSTPFIYLPLHYTPETSDYYFGTLYDHHEGFVTQLAKFIPSHMQLYVKEHTSMLGRRSTGFYQALNRLPHVRMIDPRVDTFSLIKNSAAVLTVTGTAGWEAFLLGKPCVALGSVFYNFLPGVLHCPLDKDFAQRLAQFLETFTPSPAVSRNGYRACYASSFSGDKVDFDGTSRRADALASAAGFANALRQVIERFGAEIPGAFPADLLDQSAAARAA